MSLQILVDFKCLPRANTKRWPNVQARWEEGAGEGLRQGNREGEVLGEKRGEGVTNMVRGRCGGNVSWCNRVEPLGHRITTTPLLPVS
jgi:hypothetical protein